mgnify:CR=1 FL=1
MKKIKINIVEACDPCAAAAPQPAASSMPNAHNQEEARMHRTTLAHLLTDTKMLLDMIDDSDDLPEWLETKITKAGDYMASAMRYISGNIARDAGYLEENISLPIKDQVMNALADLNPEDPEDASTLTTIHNMLTLDSS